MREAFKSMKERGVDDGHIFLLDRYVIKENQPIEYGHRPAFDTVGISKKCHLKEV